MLEVLPIAIAIAVSPFAMVPVILYLLSERPHIMASGFLAGWFTGVLAVTFIGCIATDMIVLADTSGELMDWAKLVLGAILVAVASYRLLKRGASKKSSFLSSIAESTSPQKAVRSGLLLSMANPKVIILAISGGVTIGAQGMPFPAELGYVALFSIISSIAILVPLVLHALLGKRAKKLLKKLNGWLERNSDLLMNLILLIIGLVLLLNSVTALL